MKYLFDYSRIKCNALCVQIKNYCVGSYSMLQICDKNVSRYIIDYKYYSFLSAYYRVSDTNRKIHQR